MDIQLISFVPAPINRVVNLLYTSALKSVTRSDPWISQILMNTLQSITVLIIGLAAGLLAGMFGIGGGVIIVPAMMLLVGFSIKMSAGTSLAALLLPVGLLGAIEYFRNGQINLTAAICLILGLFIGTYFGAKLTLALPELYVKRAFGVLLLLLAIRYLTFSK